MKITKIFVAILALCAFAACEPNNGNNGGGGVDDIWGDNGSPVGEWALTEWNSSRDLPFGVYMRFNEDKSFTMTLGKRTINGTYELNQSTKEVTLSFGKGMLGGLAKHTLYLTKTGNNIDLVGNADKLLKLIQTTISASSNNTLATIGKLTEGYDGMMLGFSFTK